jgi:hypothetical protein
MTVSLQRLDQLHKPDTFVDTKTAVQIAAAETASVDMADYHEYIISQIKRIIHGDQAGNWHDDPGSVHGGDASLYALFNQTSCGEKNALKWSLNLTDITVPAGKNVVLLSTAGFPPSRPIAILNTTKGAVVAQLAGALTNPPTHDMTENSGENALKPKNLVAIFDGDTGDPILSSDRRVWGLLQVGSGATDGNSFTLTGNDQGQISLVRPNATFDDLEAVPYADVENKKIIYSYSDRNDLASLSEDSYRGDLGEADPVTPGFGGLDRAYDGGHYMEVDGSDVDIRLADTKAWVVRSGSGGSILWQIVRNDGGTTKVQVGSTVDVFDNDAADSNFAEGMAVDTAGQAINIGKTALGVLDSASIETRATGGDNTVAASADVKFKTVRETTALPLDDATTGTISGLKTVFEGSGSFVSVADAIKYAIQEGGVDLTLKIFVAGSNYGQGVNIPAATLDLTTHTIDMNTPANTDTFLFLNGRLLYGGNGTTKNDVYAGTAPASGDLMVDFPKGVKSGDVIITLALQQ